MVDLLFSLGISPLSHLLPVSVWWDEDGEPHHRRGMPLEVQCLQLLLPRTAKKGITVISLCPSSCYLLPLVSTSTYFVVMATFSCMGLPSLRTWYLLFFFSSQVYGTVHDAQGVARYLMKGYWDQKLDCGRILGGEGKNVITEPLKTLWEAVPPQ